MKPDWIKQVVRMQDTNPEMVLQFIEHIVTMPVDDLNEDLFHVSINMHPSILSAIIYATRDRAAGLPRRDGLMQSMKLQLGADAVEEALAILRGG